MQEIISKSKKNSSKKTKYKIIASSIMILSIICTFFYFISGNEKFDRNKDAEIDAFLLDIDLKKMIINLNLKFYNIKNSERIKLNDLNIEIGKDKRCSVEIPFFMSKNYFVFKSFFFRLRFDYKKNGILANEINTFNYINNFDISYNENTDRYNLNLKHKIKLFYMIVWLTAAVFVLLVFGFVCEVWIRKKGGSVLQLVFVLLSTNFLVNLERILHFENFYLDANKKVFLWCYFCNFISTIMFLIIFVFRYKNSKFVGGNRKKTSEGCKSIDNEIFVV